MAAIEDFLADCERRMDRSIETTRQEFNSVRTGRASTALLDRIVIDYYGTQTPLNNMATISAPEARLLSVQPYDPTQIKAIEKAIMESDLGLTPSNDGKLIRLPIPQLTEERRKELVKVVRRYAEEGKVAIRNVRRDVMRHLEELVRNGDVGDDEERRAEKRGAGADRRPRQADRRDPQAQGSGDSGGVTPHGATPLARPSVNSEGASARFPLVAGREASGDIPAVPRSVAIIMDGNGRWAEARNLPVAPGHREGTRALRRTVEASIDHGIRVARRVRVLDRELGPSGGRGADAAGDPLGDDRPRAARSRRAGRPHAVHRPARPRARLAAREDGGLEGRRLTSTRSTSGSPSTTAAGRSSSTARAAGRGRRRPPTRSTRTRSPRGSMLPSCATSICSSARRASGESRTSCSGRRRIPSSCSPTRSGPTSTPATCATRWTSSRVARAASEHASVA